MISCYFILLKNKNHQSTTNRMCIKHWNLQCFLSMSLNAFNTTLGKWYIPSLSGGPWGGGLPYIYISPLIIRLPVIKGLMTIPLKTPLLTMRTRNRREGQKIRIPVIPWLMFIAMSFPRDLKLKKNLSMPLVIQAVTFWFPKRWVGHVYNLWVKVTWKHHPNKGHQQNCQVFIFSWRKIQRLVPKDERGFVSSQGIHSKDPKSKGFTT